MTNIRKDPLVKDNVYHIYSRSIAGFVIFNNQFDYIRFVDLLKYYRSIDQKLKYSKFELLDRNVKQAMIDDLERSSKMYVTILAYCVMPTHIHLILRQETDGGISNFMSKVLNSYTKYFNIKLNRQGPLWTQRFKSVLVSNDEQLLHLTRYIHLNPTSVNLVKKPEDWEFSSYNEYLEVEDLCKFRDILTISPKSYKKFVNDRKDYQQQLSIIKATIIENYHG